MAFAIPSLDDVLERTRQAFKTNLPSADAYAWPSSIYVAAKVIAARVWEAFHRLEFIKDQAFILTATGTYLDRHAQQLGLSRNPAVAAEGDATGTSGTSGTVLPVGTLLINSLGYSYELQTAQTVAADGSVTLDLVSVETGVEYNLEAGTSLTFATAIAGAPTSVVVSSAAPVSGGAAEEEDEDLRIRLLQRIQNPPHTGTATDYERWTLEVPGVTRAWVGKNAFGAGTVGIWFAMDDTYANGIPTAADVATVQAYIDTLAPITANPVVFQAIADPLRIEITGLYPYSTTIAAKVRSEIESMIKEKASISTNGDTFYFRRSWIWQAVSNATGEEYHTVALPIEDFAVPVGYINTYEEAFVSITA